MATKTIQTEELHPLDYIAEREGDIGKPDERSKEVYNKALAVLKLAEETDKKIKHPAYIRFFEQGETLAKDIIECLEEPWSARQWQKPNDLAGFEKVLTAATMLIAAGVDFGQKVGRRG